MDFGVGLAAPSAAMMDMASSISKADRRAREDDFLATKPALLGLESLPSQTNFVYFKSGKEANTAHSRPLKKRASTSGPIHGL